MNRRDFLKFAGAGVASVAFAGCGDMSLSSAGFGRKKPNIVYILADDLGYRELGCYGQQKIKTPNLDKLASEGMKFTQHYSGSTVCAPSRCVLLTGKHTGHAYIRDNYEMGGWERGNTEGQLHMLAGTETVASMLKRAGYSTGVMGKWGLGGPNTPGEPNKMGFDWWCGYLCQRQAHNYYPEHLWLNGRKLELNNEYFSAHQKLPEDADPNDKKSYAAYSGKEYAMDVMTDQALKFVQANKDNPFFLYLPYPVPHVSIQVPEDSLAEYDGAFPETPYKGQMAYLPHMTPRAAYAAMITRMDRDIGKVLGLIDQLGLTDNTLVIFSSDNGTTFNGGSDAKFFASVGELRGLKCSLYEGGIRVPMIAKWPGRIEPETLSDHVSAFWDVMPTLADAAGIEVPADIDGISMMPTLLGKPKKQKEHDYLYWEYAKRMQAVRWGQWKAVRLRPDKDIQLFNLAEDIGESNNVAAKHPDVVKKIDEIMTQGRTTSKEFPFPGEKADS